MQLDKNKSDYQQLIEQIKQLVQEAKHATYRTINKQIIQTYWEVGKLIHKREKQVAFDEQSSRALISQLSKELTLVLGKGFHRSNLTYMRLFYLAFPTGVTVSHQLSWSHYVELLKVDDKVERSFYAKQASIEKWSVRELRRQRNSALFQRLALSKDKKGILRLAQQGQLLETEEDLIKDPYVLEFLNLPEGVLYSEKLLEKRIIENLQHFLLEMGKGFAFIGNQYRITLNNTHFYIDLVFYHRILKCFVLIDLKIGEAKHQDIGQMNMYLNYFKEEENETNDNPPIGIILAAAKDEIMIQYATGGLSNRLFVSKYQTHLPEKQLLEDKVRRILDEEE